MKKSNIILICIVVISVSWLLISGWLQANAYKIITSGKTCSYAFIEGHENKTPCDSFEHIKINVAEINQFQWLVIESGKDHSLCYSTSLKGGIGSRVHQDTLYMTLNKNTIDKSAFINISSPYLKSVTIKNTSDSILKKEKVGLYVHISGFKGNTLSIYNSGQNSLRLNDNQINKLVIKGNFYEGKEIEITKSSECDSLDIDVEGQNGSLIIGNSYFKTKEYPMRWTNIRVPGSFRVAANADVASKIILKK